LLEWAETVRTKRAERRANRCVPPAFKAHRRSRCIWRRRTGFHAAADAVALAARNGKQERGGEYVKSNALKGRRFESLEAQNLFHQTVGLAILENGHDDG
jgi:hypothetical protein